MKLEEIVQLTETEIKQRLEDSLEELQNLRFQHATHQLDNPLRLRTLRREIAQLKTILHEFELGLRTPVQQATVAKVE
ncbi:MAG: 50S ribosomal protein L29 [candidate division KSB1 bacterium]|nr:50S ribosomal protein L29 [candidate division KSB1 bacterium]MDZ7317749.1 50S ribosomal protein L29 [candidate division KSB1 bacterium]MDZ7339981.1 50S ribosomal protein L29 [candidate division KSB1 bacterium]